MYSIYMYIYHILASIFLQVSVCGCILQGAASSVYGCRIQTTCAAAASRFKGDLIFECFQMFEQPKYDRDLTCIRFKDKHVYRFNMYKLRNESQLQRIGSIRLVRVVESVFIDEEKKTKKKKKKQNKKDKKKKKNKS